MRARPRAHAALTRFAVEVWGETEKELKVNRDSVCARAWRKIEL